MTMYFKTLDPEYRPDSYWPESLFANIKGLVRRELLQQAVEIAPTTYKSMVGGTGETPEH